MLKSLHIKNFAIIEEVQLDFERGLHVITGETGAGKSIMLDALGLALGERVKGGTPSIDGEKTIVEAQFDLTDLNLHHLFENEGVDYFDVAILRREIQGNGRSRAFVNDTPTTLTFLQNLASHLIEVHQQFDQLALRESSFQYDVLDVLAKQKGKVSAYKASYRQWNKDQARLVKLKEAAAALQKEQDFLEFQFDELESFAPELKDDELGDLQTMLSQSEELQSTIQQVNVLLGDEDGGALDQLRTSLQQLNSFRSHQKLQDWLGRAEELLTELDDLLQSLTDVVDIEEFDGERLAEIEDRLSIFFRLKKKHAVESAEDLIRVQQDIEGQLETIQNSDQEISELEKDIDEQHKKLKSSAKEISRARSLIIPQLEARVQSHLKGLGMPDAMIQVALTKGPLSENGIDQVEFLFSSNKGVPPSPIKLTASGGEISRLNLAIKSEVAGEMALPTIIFDEIDSGVSGEVARKIATLLEKLSQRHQIICITHTPQIASAKARHFHVSKDSAGAKTKTIASVLSLPARQEKIAEMLDGIPPSQEALKNAEKLLGR